VRLHFSGEEGGRRPASVPNAMRAMRPPMVLAWWSWRPIWRLRVAKTLSITSRMRALAISAAVRIATG
jgi:hypothetical protein